MRHWLPQGVVVDQPGNHEGARGGERAPGPVPEDEADTRDRTDGHYEGRPARSREDEAERLDRNWNELLQEIRVMQTGVQIVTGFLLTVPFSARFPDLDDFQVRTYLAVLSASMLASALVVAPAAFHRVLFRRRERPWLVVAANVCVRAGLGALMATSCGALLLVFDVVTTRTLAWTVFGVALGVFVVLWVVLPSLRVARK